MNERLVYDRLMVYATYAEAKQAERETEIPENEEWEFVGFTEAVYGLRTREIVFDPGISKRYGDKDGYQDQLERYRCRMVET